MSTQTTSNRIFFIYLLLAFYCFGAAMMNEFVVYASWAEAGRYISAPDFAKWHAGISGNIALTLVAPMFILTPVILLLFWFRPAVIPRWSLFTVLSCHAVAWLCTTLLQLPIELQFDHGQFSPALVNHLRHISWIRIMAFITEICLATYMVNLFPAASGSRKETVPVTKPNVPFTVVRGRLINHKQEALVK